MSWLDQVSGYGAFPARLTADSAGRVYYDEESFSIWVVAEKERADEPIPDPGRHRDGHCRVFG